MDEFSASAVRARDSEDEFHKLAMQYEHYILKQASKACGRIVTKSDDEWSVALLAFHKAVEAYEPGKGKFYSFAAVVIRRQLLDHFRKENRHAAEIAAAPETFDGGVDYDEADAFETEVANSIARQQKNDDRQNLADEMDALDQTLAPYGFRLYDVAASSPKRGRTRAKAMAAVRAVLEQPELRRQMKQKTRLPYSTLLKERKATKKILERYRTYIIATIEIMDGDYPLLKDFALGAEG